MSDKAKRYVVAWTEPVHSVDWGVVSVELADWTDFEVFDDYEIALQSEHLRKRDGMVTMLIDLHENGYGLVEVEQ